MPNGNHIQSSGTTNIPWPNLPNTATKAHILPELNPHSLVSIGVLCDHNCTATFDKHAVTIHRQNQPILTGPRLPNGLWTSLSRKTAPNTTPTPSLHHKQNNNWFNGFTHPPLALALAPSSTQSNATSSQLGPASPPTSSDAISPKLTPLSKATLTNNDNANVKSLFQKSNPYLQPAPALTPYMPPFWTPRHLLAAPTATSPVVSRSNQIAAQTTY